MPRLLTAALLVALIAAGCGNDGAEAPGTQDEDAASEEIDLTYASFVGEDDSFAQQAQWFMNEVTQRTNGRVQFEQFWAGSLLPAEEIFEGIKSGRVDAGHVANVYSPSELPLSQITVPFISTNGEAVTRTLEDLYQEHDAFRAEWEDQGAKVLAFGIVGNATLGMAKPVAGLEDLQGARLRAVGLTGVALQAVGVDPVALPAPDIYESIQRGVVDGYAGLPFQTAIQLGMAEVAPHMLETGMGVFALVGVFTISTDTWESLPSDVQEVMVDVGKETTDVGVDILNAVNEEACDQLIDSGGSVTVVPQDKAEEWRNDVFQDPILTTWRKDAQAAGVDPQVVEDFEEAFFERLERYEAESNFVDGFTACARRS
jgi:TRAP-type C4-dicarboxylate transport system substrate-binding protein